MKTPLTGLGIAGSGRWARVIAGISDPLIAGRWPGVVASGGGTSRWVDWTHGRPGWSVAPSIEAMLADDVISHVVIARAASDHAITAIRALDAGMAVLIEKPFCLTLEELDAVLAAVQGRDCGTGIVFHFARYHHRFRNACLEHGPPTILRLDWVDAEGEIRHGGMKTFDPSLNVVQDVLPHAWSILRPFVADAAMTLSSVRTNAGGADVTLELSMGRTQAEVRFLRKGRARHRRLSVKGENYDAWLDFATEPGKAELNSEPLDVKTGHYSPLERELRQFLAGELPQLARLETAAESIGLAIQAAAAIRDAQRALLRRACLGSANSIPDDAKYAHREVAAGGPAATGRPASREELAQWLGVDATAYSRLAGAG